MSSEHSWHKEGMTVETMKAIDALTSETAFMERVIAWNDEHIFGNDPRDQQIHELERELKNLQDIEHDLQAFEEWLSEAPRGY